MVVGTIFVPTLTLPFRVTHVLEMGVEYSTGEDSVCGQSFDLQQVPFLDMRAGCLGTVTRKECIIIFFNMLAQCHSASPKSG